VERESLLKNPYFDNSPDLPIIYPNTIKYNNTIKKSDNNYTKSTMTHPSLNSFQMYENFSVNKEFIIDCIYVVQNTIQDDRP
jgi:hypothetical protein